MVYELLREYAKVMNWFISEYPNETIELELKNNSVEDRISFLVIFSSNGQKYSSGTYVQKSWIGTEMLTDLRFSIGEKLKRAIKEQKGHVGTGPQTGSQNGNQTLHIDSERYPTT